MSLRSYEYFEGVTNLQGSGGSALINVQGQIFDSKGKELPYGENQEGDKTVVCPGWDGIREYRVIDLVALQFKRLVIGMENYGSVIAFVIDGDKQNTHASNVGYRFKGGKLEVKNHPGFYYVPGATGVAINASGVLLRVLSNKYSNWYITSAGTKNAKGGYYTTVFCIRGWSYTLGRHRAMLLVFKGYPDNVDTLVTNHKNGIPGDDRLDNLEWVTRLENNQHAFDTGLRSSTIPVLIRNVLTGEVKEFASKELAKRYLGIQGGNTMVFRLDKAKFGHVFHDGTQVKYKNDLRDWIIPEDPVKAIEEAKTAKRSIKAKNCFNGIERVYESITEASQDLHIGVDTIAQRFKVKNFKPLFGWLFKDLEDNSPWYSYTEEELLISMQPASEKAEARNLLTGEHRNYDSVRQACLDVGTKWSQDVLRQGRQPLLATGWQIKKEADIWEEIPDFEAAIYKLQLEVTARCEATGKLYLASSCAQMASNLGLHAQTLRKAAMTRGNKVYGGYRFMLGINLDTEWPETQTA